MVQHDPLFDISGKRALITGASSGLGRHFAHLLASRGASVVPAARRAEALDAVCRQIEAEGGEARSLVLDVADGDAVRTALKDEAFDIVVNNAGISRTGTLIDLAPEDWQSVMDVDLTAAFNVAQTAARTMRDNGKGGTIINVASILGKRVAGGVGAYTAAKAGLVQLTRAMALEWARFDIRVNALCPGYFSTEINKDFFASDHGQAMVKRIPMRRIGELSDLDGPLMLLASDAGRFMTGTEIVADGGHLVSGL
ncbi:SDR family NAD(P)-dependent oxidoreductase [Hoeflea sp.]|uniref:SDR family NAD(P)-dependent oxidoreductase n=1 Tax=Hoeflea sp. TaxID=1940281 RepID=UPI003B5225D6